MIIILFLDRFLTTIDIGNSAIKIAGFKKRKSSLKLVGSGISKLPEGSIVEGEIQDHAVLAAELEKLIKRMNFRPKNIVTTIPNDNLVIRNVEVPGAVAEELSDAIKWEADEYLPFPVDQATLDYVIVEKDHENIKIILAATRKEVVEDYLKVFQEINLKPVVMNVQPMAFISLLDYQQEELSTIAVIDVGASSTRIVIGDKEGIYLFRTIDTGGNDFTKIIMESMELDYSEAEKYKINNGISLSQEDVDQIGEDDERKNSADLATEDFIRQVSSSGEMENKEEFAGLEEVDELVEPDHLEGLDKVEAPEDLAGLQDDISQELNLDNFENMVNLEKTETESTSGSNDEYDLNQPLESLSNQEETTTEEDSIVENNPDQQSAQDNLDEESFKEDDFSDNVDLNPDSGQFEQQPDQSQAATESDILSPEANNLAYDISRSFDFFNWNNTDKNIDKIFITGGGSKLKGLVEIIEKEVDMELKRIDPFAGLPAGKKDVSTKKDELAVALGLACSEVLKK